MTGATLDPVAARRLIEARLGRRPQDMLEAAVALEAWAGLSAQPALDAAREVMREGGGAPAPSTGALPDRDEEQGALAEALTFLLSVIAIAGWAGPLAASAGAGTVQRAVMLALPVTLGLQWGLSSRFLGRPHGRAALAARRGVLVVAGAALAGAGWLGAGTAGLIAALLTVTWVGGTVLVRCRMPAVYAVAILLTTAAMLVHPAPVAVLAAGAGAVLLAILVAVRPPADVPRGGLARASRVAAAAAIGSATGLLLIVDPTVSWTDGAVPALALLPSAFAGFWAAYRLRDLGEAIPRSIWGVAVGAPAPCGFASPPLRLFLAALAQLLAVAAVLSALVLASPWSGPTGDAVGLLAGFGLLGPATLLAGVLESLGRAPVVLAAFALAAGAEALLRWGDLAPFAGAGLVAGGLVVTALLLPVALMVLGRPASTLATALWIT